MHATMLPRLLIRVSLCVFCLLIISMLLVPGCMARGPYDPDPGEHLGSDLPETECGQLEVAVKRILRDRAKPDKRVPDFTDTEYRWYTDCPAGRIAWEHKKIQGKRELEERVANYGRTKGRPNSLDTSVEMVTQLKGEPWHLPGADASRKVALVAVSREWAYEIGQTVARHGTVGELLQFVKDGRATALPAGTRIKILGRETYRALSLVQIQILEGELKDYVLYTYALYVD